MGCIFEEFDEWAYDIEQEYKNGKYISPKKKKQYVNICGLRDEYYDLYLKKIEDKNKYCHGRWFPSPKSCTKRFSPPNPPKQY